MGQKGAEGAACKVRGANVIGHDHMQDPGLGSRLQRCTYEWSISRTGDPEGGRGE